MRPLRWLLLLFAAIALAALAVANRQTVTFSLDPLPWQLDLPLYAVLFAGLLIGLLSGMLVEAMQAWRWRRRAGRWQRQAETSARQATAAQRQAAAHAPTTLPAPPGRT